MEKSPPTEKLATGLDVDEENTMDSLIGAWKNFVNIKDVDSEELNDFRKAIHEAQRILMSRALARQFPKYYN